MDNLTHVIRKFNRFELKYLLTITQAERFKQALGAYLRPDEHGDGDGAYALANLYYDSPGYRFYWEKLDGIRYRRKLRIRSYAAPADLTSQTPVFVEIKQRLNRVTQKRRVLLPYQDALHLCSRGEVYIPDGSDQAVVDEVTSMCWQYDLRPASIITYTRSAWVGSDYDTGLRVTFDRDLHCRTTSLALDSDMSGQFLFPPGFVVMEIKVNERIPYWLTELVAQHNLPLVRISKYCRSIELAQQVPAESIPYASAWQPGLPVMTRA